METLRWNPFFGRSRYNNSLAASLSRIVTPRCPRCYYELRGGRVEVLTQFKNWFLGWRKLSCEHCSHSESRLVIVHAPQRLVYQTHVVC
jgi:hypothetical protein